MTSCDAELWVLFLFANIGGRETGAGVFFGGGWRGRVRCRGAHMSGVGFWLALREGCSMGRVMGSDCLEDVARVGH